MKFNVSREFFFFFFCLRLRQQYLPAVTDFLICQAFDFQGTEHRVQNSWSIFYVREESKASSERRWLWWWGWFSINNILLSSVLDTFCSCCAQTNPDHPSDHSWYFRLQTGWKSWHDLGHEQILKLVVVGNCSGFQLWALDGAQHNLSGLEKKKKLWFPINKNEENTSQKCKVCNRFRLTLTSVFFQS